MGPLGSIISKREIRRSRPGALPVKNNLVVTSQRKALQPGARSTIIRARTWIRPKRPYPLVKGRDGRRANAKGRRESVFSGDA